MQHDDDIWIDGNGVLAERTRLGGQDVIVHYDDRLIAFCQGTLTIVHGSSSVASG